MRQVKRADLISFSGSEIDINGNLLVGDAAARVKDAVGREIGKLTKQGRDEVVRTLNARPAASENEQKRAGQRGRGRTGFTARNVEAVHEPRNSIFGKIRMRENILRPGNPDERAAYIVASVLEDGRKFGTREYKVVYSQRTGWARYRSTWRKGSRVQEPVKMFRNATRMLRRITPGRVEAVINRVTK